MDIRCQNFWIKVNQLFDDYGIMQKTFCEEYGYGVSNFRALKSRVEWPKLEIIFDLAKYFNVSLDWLLLGDTKQYNLSEDVLSCARKLDLLTPEQRKPVISIIEGQVDYWKNNS